MKFNARTNFVRFITTMYDFIIRRHAKRIVNAFTTKTSEQKHQHKGDHTDPHDISKQKK